MKKFPLARLLKDMEDDAHLLAPDPHERLTQAEIRKTVADLRRKKKAKS